MADPSLRGTSIGFEDPPVLRGIQIAVGDPPKLFGIQIASEDLPDVRGGEQLYIDSYMQAYFDDYVA